MKLTRIIALAIIAGTFNGQGAIAQQLRSASPPAEVPPSSYQGRQYVDSRGCVYIRAGIDGVVNWVPRVERSRRQICGFQPTNVAGATAPTQRVGTVTPELITLPEADQPATAPATNTARPAPRAVAAPAPQVVPQQKPRRAAPSPVVAKRVPQPVPEPKPVQRVKRVEAAPVQVAPAPQRAASGTCAGLSDVSRQYTNTDGVRCGPQSQSPVTFGPQSSLSLPADTRVLPAHLYADRQAAADVETPPGYRQVWQDGRLNPRRGEQDLYPAAVTTTAVPEGFTRVPSLAPRYNPQRGVRTASGDIQTAQLWTETLPRKQVQIAPPQTIRVEDRHLQTSAQLGFLSPEASAALAATAPQLATPRYVRADVFGDAQAAAEAAQRLARTGLPVRMGRTTRGGQEMKVVLAGPFREDGLARSALATVRNAGFPAARLSK